MRGINIIAEVGNLHGGSLPMARKFIDRVVASGADIIKFQTHIFDVESLPNAPAPSYFNKESRKDYFERTAFTATQWKKIKEYCGKCGIEFMASVFSIEAVDILEQIGVKRHKIPSGEVTNLPLLERVAATGKPVLLSSGMSSWNELNNAIKTLRNNGCCKIVIFQCSSVYPCPPDSVGLNVLTQMKNRYRIPLGFSDHTMGFSASIAAVVLGASFLERHFTLSRKMYGSDAKHSLEPDEFKRFVQEIREVEIMCASKTDKDKAASTLKEMKVIFEKSIVAKNNISKGTVIRFDMLSFKKPGDGIRVDKYKEILGRMAKKDINKNTKITKEMLK